MKTTTSVIALALSVATGATSAGVLDPECTAQKAAKSAAMKSTVGVGGRCSPKEAAADTAKRATGADDFKKGKQDKGLLGKDKNDN